MVGLFSSRGLDTPPTSDLGLPVLLSLSDSDEASKDRHDHLGLDFYDVFWESVDGCTNLACHGQGILSVA